MTNNNGMSRQNNVQCAMSAWPMMGPVDRQQTITPEPNRKDNMKVVEQINNIERKKKKGRGRQPNNNIKSI